MNGGQDILAKHVLVASGSSKSMWSLLESAGHTIVSPVPSLFSFNTKDRRLKNQSGRSFQHVELKGKIGSRTLKAAGPMLITHWGLSGPAILKLSSIFARELFDVDYHTQIQINFLPSLNQEETERVLKEHQEKNDKKKLKNSSIKVFPLSYWVNLLETIGIQPNMMWADVSNVNRARLVQEISAATFEITGKTTNKEEFVTAGGVELKEVNFQSMESQRVPNLYFAGEVLNIDGLTGGFNFQSAWSTSFIAARSASHDMTKD
jgi:hypothetical protein